MSFDLLLFCSFLNVSISKFKITHISRKLLHAIAYNCSYFVKLRSKTLCGKIGQVGLVYHFFTLKSETLIRLWAHHEREGSSAIDCSFLNFEISNEIDMPFLLFF